jgi:hypothetical protein
VDTTVTDTSADVPVDMPVDSPPDTTLPECSDGIDNDGDDLIDLEDFDCNSAEDHVEGPEDGCSVDNHCEAGYWECDRDSGECYDPPEGGLCDPCGNSADCGDGVMGTDTDRDFCVYMSSMSGRCAKDCVADFDCPKGFFCSPDVDPPHQGMCIPVVGSCGALDVFGSGCGRPEDCGWSEWVTCVEGTCTSHCEVEHDCPMHWSCVEGLCVED